MDNINEQTLAGFIEILEKMDIKEFKEKFHLSFIPEQAQYVIGTVKDIDIKKKISFDLVTEYKNKLYRNIPVKLHVPSFGEIRGYCPKCDSLLNSTDKFCHCCGISLYWGKS